MNIVPSTYWGGELNRCTITTKNGPMMLSVPIYHSRKQQPVQDIEICYMHAWQRQHWTAIFSAYGKTPYFEYYADYIRPLYERQPKWLVDLNDETAILLHSLMRNDWPSHNTDFVPLIGDGMLDKLMNFGPETK